MDKAAKNGVRGVREATGGILDAPLAPHAHRWRLDEPSGPVSEGICLCGETRQFHNYTDGWLGDSWGSRNNDFAFGTRAERLG